MVMEIKKYGDPILKNKAQDVREITPEIKDLVLNMEKTMESSQGIGLAAPQVGVPKRIILVQTEEGPKVFINPKIVKKSRSSEIIEEGCLSLPGLFLKIKRAKMVAISSKDIDGKDVEIKAEGMLARIFQHEIDHLDGVLIIDKISFWKKFRIKK